MSFKSTVDRALSIASPLAAPACGSSPPGLRLVLKNKLTTRVKRRERWCSDKGFGGVMLFVHLESKRSLVRCFETLLGLLQKARHLHAAGYGGYVITTVLSHAVSNQRLPRLVFSSI